MKTRIFIVFFVVSFLTPAWAQSDGVVTADQVAVHEKPNAKSEILVTLDKGKHVTVLSKKPGWLQVKAQLDPAFSLSGWVSDRHIKWKGRIDGPVKTPAPALSKRPPSLPRGQARAAQAAPSARAPAPGSAELDRFFALAQPTPTPIRTAAPPEAQRTSVPAAIRATPTAPVYAAPAVPKREAPVLTVEPQPALEPEAKPEVSESPSYALFSNWSASLGTGFLLHSYDLTNRSGNVGTVLSYTLPGIGVKASLSHWFWTGLQERLRAGTALSFQYGYYRFSTDIKNASGTTTSSESSDGSSYDGIVRFPFEYRVGSLTHPVVLGANMAFEYLRFNLHDVQGNSGPMLLYVNQTVMSLLGGAEVRSSIPGVAELEAAAGVDLLFLNWVSEKPGNATGTDPKGSLGFVPHVEATWTPNERHHLSAGYQLRLQHYRFSGTASRVGTGNVQDGQATMTSHDVFLRYDYFFGRL
ncbi:MAG: SH3 domain-containing protein [Pseudomonadota bacterium]